MSSRLINQMAFVNHFWISDIMRKPQEKKVKYEIPLNHVVVSDKQTFLLCGLKYIGKVMTKGYVRVRKTPFRAYNKKYVS